MAGKQHLEPSAFRMFCAGADQREIAGTLSISEQTISSWKSTYNWDERRNVYVRSTHATVDKLRKLLSEFVDKLENLDDDKAADKLVKLTASIERLDSHFDFLGNVLKVSEEWIVWASSNDDELFKLLQGSLPRFLAHCRTKFQH
jgi:hypothetical protein